MQKQSILEAVAQATRLREGPAGVSAMLRAVYRAGSLRLQDAARQVRLPLPVATAIRRELEKAGLLERRHGLTLTGEGREFVERELGLRMKIDATCPTCRGSGIVIPATFAGLVERLADIIARAPSVDVTLDQAPCTPDTSLRRALLMLQAGALEGQRVVVLGDDDSLSIAIGLLGRALGQNDLARELVVIDADERRLSFIRAVAASEDLPIALVHHDLRQPLPMSLRRSFDVIQTDPPYTLEGARLFLTRGREALRTDAGGVCFLSFAQWPASQMLGLQRLFIDLGLAVRAVRPAFNQYLGATVLGNVGQLVELVHVGTASTDLPAWTGPLYTADVNPRSRSYVCADCAVETVLGQDGAPTTIEALKARGCRNCGGHTFRRQSAES